MDENTIIDQLEKLIKRFGIQIRREPIKQDEDLVRVVGGLCLNSSEQDRVYQNHPGHRNGHGHLEGQSKGKTSPFKPCFSFREQDQDKQ